MRLTNFHRDAFINRAMDDVPRKHADFDEELRNLALRTVVAHMPPQVAQVWSRFPDWIQQGTVWLRPSDFGCEWPGSTLTSALHTPFADRGVLLKWLKKPEYAPQFKALFDSRNEERSRIDALEKRLRAVAYGCTTRAALAKALPEFEKYLPAEEGGVDRTVPAVANVVADFVKAGWPKGQAQIAVQ